MKANICPNLFFTLHFFIFNQVDTFHDQFSIHGREPPTGSCYFQGELWVTTHPENSENQLNKPYECNIQATIKDINVGYIKDITMPIAFIIQVLLY